MDFCDKVVIVTGASSGIGKACALHFAKLSAKLTLVGRNKENLNQVQGECEELSGIKPFIVIADISKEDDVDRISKETINYYGKIDVLVNNAGIVHMGGVMDSITDFDKINRATCPLPAMTGCCMTKAAVDMLTKCVAIDVAPKGVRVNSVNPGPVRTEIFRRAGLDEKANEQLYLQLGMSMPLKKVANSDDIAQLVAFIASENASSITGSTHFVDCGMQLGVPVI